MDSRTRLVKATPAGQTASRQHLVVVRTLYVESCRGIPSTNDVEEDAFDRPSVGIDPALNGRLEATNSRTPGNGSNTAISIYTYIYNPVAILELAISLG